MFNKLRVKFVSHDPSRVDSIFPPGFFRVKWMVPNTHFLFQNKDSTRWKPDETNNECGVRSIPAHIRAGQTTKVITICENLMFFAVVFILT